MKNILKNSIILITGGTGSWGQELTTQLLNIYKPREIRIYSRGEHKQVEMKRKFQNQTIKYYIGDVRDRDRLIQTSKNVDYIFHLAALKHVPVCEENPWEAVQTNIIGTQNIIEAGLINKVKKVIDISTDKAVDPLNLYGTSKAVGEKLMIAANLVNSGTSFVCIRGGNVIGTNGSVVPLFKEQLVKLNHITLTDDRMTRFFISLNEAINLVLKAAIESIGGEILVIKMPACKITDLAKVMINKLGNKETKTSSIGVRPGEKIYEVLVSKYEIPRTYDFGKYFVILPQIPLEKTKEFYKNKKLLHADYDEFNSTNTTILKSKSIEKLLKNDGWFNDEDKHEALRYLETLSKKDLRSFSKTERWAKE